ncbi:hypothetical protein B5E80_09660 [Flavonifractor sp. An135]|nr:MBL fold metallo-hydrolase [Flavonifractor sp. An135]OUQ23541.1 hypothetical protein B5E80_09660 [Flavonifractor sp. An135]
MQTTFEHAPYTAQRLTDGVWHIEDATRDHPPGLQRDGSFHGPGSVYVLEGTDAVLVVDLGFSYPGHALREIVDRLADGRAIRVALTHNHFDHTGALPQFQDVPIYVPVDDPVPGVAHPIPVRPGDTISWGGLSLQVLDARGHTAGSVLYYEAQRGWLATGDAFGSGYAWLFFLPDVLSVYRETLRRTLDFFRDKPEPLFLCGHRYQQQITPVPGMDPLTPRNPDLGLAYLEDMLTLTERILAGSIQGRPYEALGRTDLLTYTYGRAEIDTYPLGSAPLSI